MTPDQSPTILGSPDLYTGPYGKEVRKLFNSINSLAPDDPYFQLNVGVFNSGSILRCMAEVPLPGIDFTSPDSSNSPPNLLSLLSGMGLFRLIDSGGKIPAAVEIDGDTVKINHDNHSIQFSALGNRALEIPEMVFFSALILLRVHLKTVSSNNQQYVDVTFTKQNRLTSEKNPFTFKAETLKDFQDFLRKQKLLKIWNNIP